MKTTQADNKYQRRAFPNRFLEKCQIWNVPQGEYDYEAQVYVDSVDRRPAFVDDLLNTKAGNEITTHFSTNVNGVIFTDPDNG